MILCFRRIWFLNNFIQFSMQYVTAIRSSRSQMFFEVGVLKVCNIHRKTHVLESLFSKVASLEACNFIKKRHQHRCFPVNIAKFLRSCFCTLNSSGIWWHIWIGKLVTYIFNIILCVSIMFSSFFRNQFCWSY